MSRNEFSNKDELSRLTNQNLLLLYKYVDVYPFQNVDKNVRIIISKLSI